MRLFSFDVADRPAYDLAMARLKEAGIGIRTRWEAVPYTGAPVVTARAVVRRHGLLSWEPLVVGDDGRALETLRSFILHHPLCADWKLGVRENAVTNIQMGHFALVERTGFEGGPDDLIREIVQECGGDAEDLEFVLGSEERTLGYIPSTDEAHARAIASIVQVGATTPISRGELVDTLERFRDAAASGSRRGDPNAGRQAGIWQELADQWHQRPDVPRGVASRPTTLAVVLRWLAVLPAATLAALLAQFPLHWALMATLSSWVEPYPEAPERLLGPFVNCLVFVVTGAGVAPSRRQGAAALFALCVVGIVGTVVVALVQPDLGRVRLGFRYGGAPLALGLLGAVAGLRLSWSAERRATA